MVGIDITNYFYKLSVTYHLFAHLCHAVEGAFDASIYSLVNAPVLTAGWTLPNLGAFMANWGVTP